MQTELVTPIEYYGRIKETEVYIKREDTIPFSFGGNKVRIALEVFEEMKQRGSKRVISYGSTSSNLNRVIAQMAAERGVGCTVIVKKENTEGGHPSFNEIMVLDSGAEIIYTENGEVRDTVANTLARYRAREEDPYYIYGDETGCGGEEVLSRAYRKVSAEISAQEKELDVRFDTLVLPVGTCSTLTGLLQAEEKRNVLGISIARSRENTENKLKEFLFRIGMNEEEAAAKLASFCRITDAYLMGGYGKRNAELVPFLREQLRSHGLPLDPTYTGKAFYGMTEEIRKGNLTGTCLFLHTGGLPLFFDMMEQM